VYRYSVVPFKPGLRLTRAERAREGVLQPYGGEPIGGAHILSLSASPDRSNVITNNSGVFLCF
jgi:hypothetical protein